MVSSKKVNTESFVIGGNEYILEDSKEIAKLRKNGKRHYNIYVKPSVRALIQKHIIKDTNNRHNEFVFMLLECLKSRVTADDFVVLKKYIEVEFNINKEPQPPQANMVDIAEIPQLSEKIKNIDAWIDENKNEYSLIVLYNNIVENKYLDSDELVTLKKYREVVYHEK